MTLKKEVINLFSEEVTELTLKQIYILLPNNTKHGIRATINALVKSGEFQKVGRGTYKKILKEA